MCILKMSENWWCRARVLTHSLARVLFSHFLWFFFLHFILSFCRCHCWFGSNLLISWYMRAHLVYNVTIHNDVCSFSMEWKKVKNRKKVLTLIYISIEYWCSCSYSCQYMIAPNIYIFVWHPFVLFGSFSLLKLSCIYLSIICVLFI